MSVGTGSRGVLEGAPSAFPLLLADPRAQHSVAAAPRGAVPSGTERWLG